MTGQWTAFYKHKYDEWHVGVPTEGTMKLALCPDGILPGMSMNEREQVAERIAASCTAMEGIPDPEAYIAAARVMREALGRIATVDMGGGFLGAQACRQVASEAILAFDAAAQGEQ